MCMKNDKEREMLSEKMLNKLNKQINLEFYSSNIYLQMSSWCDNKGLSGCAKFLKVHSDEEMMHMRKLFDYVNETGGMAVIGEIKSPDLDYESIADVFLKIYEHECFVTEEINKLVDAAFTEKDFSTFNFLQWYVAEQHEEENLFKSILDKIKIIGDERKGLFFIDQELGQMAVVKGN